MTTVFVKPGALEAPGPTSFHGRRGCYKATDPISVETALEAGAEPCGFCVDDAAQQADVEAGEHIRVRCTACREVYDTVARFNFKDPCHTGRPVAI